MYPILELFLYFYIDLKVLISVTFFHLFLTHGYWVSGSDINQGESNMAVYPKKGNFSIFTLSYTF